MKNKFASFSAWMKKWRGALLFWGWNVIFLAFFLFGYGPLVVPSLVESVKNNVTPPIYLIYAIVLIAIPVILTLLGILFLRKKPEQLFKLGYVVEWPLLLILLTRFFMIRAGNTSITILLICLAVGELTFLWYLLDDKLENRPAFWQHLSLIGITLLFAGTIYASLWLTFYVPPLLYIFFQLVGAVGYSLLTSINLNPSSWQISLSSLWSGVLITSGIIIFFGSLALIMMMPIAAPILAGRAWLERLRQTNKISSRPVIALTILLPLIVVFVALGFNMQQPQVAAFQLLKHPPTNRQEAQTLLDHKEQIRAGLLNAYLASYRYLNGEFALVSIEDIYRQTFPGLRGIWMIERAYEFVLQPFLYYAANPTRQMEVANYEVLQRDANEAAQLYEDFFDQPILAGEHQEIVRAVSSTADFNQALGSLQTVDDRMVHLNRQEITTSEHADWADVQLYEVYENRSFGQAEVLYYFNLPESAVVTGLWLGTNPNRNKAFAFRVAPRGAAQAVYNNQKAINMDPALIEQVGPRQYRLRIFPVMQGEWNSKKNWADPGPKLHLWMSYRTLSVDGAWPLPKLAKKVNIYWDQSSVRLVNGQPSSAEATSWLPAAVAASAPITPTKHRIDFPGGLSVLVSPVTAKTAELTSKTRLAIILDRSYSMAEHSEDVTQAFAKIKQLFGEAPNADLYLTTTTYHGNQPTRIKLTKLTPEQLTYVGGQNSTTLLTQFEALRDGEQYDLILVLTDASEFTTNRDVPVKVPNAPLWMIHFSGQFPLAYNDSTLEALQASGGGAALTVDEALTRYALNTKAPGTIDNVDGYEWKTVSTADAGGFAPALKDDGFAALAARRLVLSEMLQNHRHLNDLSVLDQIHAIAVQQKIVTPFSSMLVLVNKEQQKQLDDLSAKGDRFQREAEAVPQPNSVFGAPTITGVPEPEEWLLMLLTAIGLAFVAWRKRTAKKQFA